MIKTLLQHSILELCINQFFDQVNKNFPIARFNVNIHHVGDYIKIIISGFDRIITLTHCKIERKEGDIVYIECNDFSEPLTLIVVNGSITDIKGSYDVICDNFLK